MTVLSRAKKSVAELWTEKQNTTSTGDRGRDRMIALAMAGRFHREHPRVRRFPIPESFQWAFDDEDAL